MMTEGEGRERVRKGERESYFDSGSMPAEDKWETSSLELRIEKLQSDSGGLRTTAYDLIDTALPFSVATSTPYSFGHFKKVH